MANTALTRPVVTMNLANRSIGRFGLLANRVMHPLAAGHFGRQVAPLAVISDLKIVPTETGIVAETSFGNINVDQPVYSRLLCKAGISEIDVPKGTDEEKIGDIFRAVTTRTATKSKIMDNMCLFKIDESPLAINGHDLNISKTTSTKHLYRSSLHDPYKPHIFDEEYRMIAAVTCFFAPGLYLAYLGISLVVAGSAYGLDTAINALTGVHILDHIDERIIEYAPFILTVTLPVTIPTGKFMSDYIAWLRKK